MLKPLLVVASLCAVIVVATAAIDPLPQDQGAGAKATKTSSEAMAKAKKFYEMECALCHNANGDGKSDLAKDMQLSLQDWTNAKSLESKTDAELFASIRNGKGKMPAESPARAKDDEVYHVIHYIRTLSAASPAVSDAK